MDKTHYNGLALATLPGLVMSRDPPASSSSRWRSSSSPIDAPSWPTSGRLGRDRQGLAARAGLATDSSPCAVAVARANVRRHRLAARVTVRLADLLDPVPGPVDVIVANLPYLPAGDTASTPISRPSPPTRSTRPATAWSSPDACSPRAPPA